MPSPSGLGLHGPAIDDADAADDVLDGPGCRALAPDVWGMHLRGSGGLGLAWAPRPPSPPLRGLDSPRGPSSQCGVRAHQPRLEVRGE